MSLVVSRFYDDHSIVIRITVQKALNNFKMYMGLNMFKGITDKAKSLADAVNKEPLLLKVRDYKQKRADANPRFTS